METVLGMGQEHVEVMVRMAVMTMVEAEEMVVEVEWEELVE